MVLGKQDKNNYNSEIMNISKNVASPWGAQYRVNLSLHRNNLVIIQTFLQFINFKLIKMLFFTKIIGKLNIKSISSELCHKDHTKTLVTLDNRFTEIFLCLVWNTLTKLLQYTGFLIRNIGEPLWNYIDNLY